MNNYGCHFSTELKCAQLIKLRGSLKLHASFNSSTNDQY